MREASSEAGSTSAAGPAPFTIPELQAALEAAGLGVFQLDLAAGVLHASPSLIRLLGLPNDASPTLATLRRLCHPDDRPLLRRWARDRRRTGDRSIRGDCRIMVGGGQRWLHVRGAAVGTGMTGVVVDVTEQHEAEAAARALADRREVMLQELHHRIKNNLQLVSSLLRLQAARSEDEQLKRELDRACQRLVAIADVHEALRGGEEGTRLDFGAYLQALCERLAISFLEPLSPTIEIDVAAEPCMVGVDRALPLGLIANELVVNAIKHAFTGTAAGHIHVGFKKQGAGWTLAVTDTGSGPPPVPAAKRQGVGMLMVESFARQLGATFRPSHEGGYRVELDLPPGS